MSYYKNEKTSKGEQAVILCQHGWLGNAGNYDGFFEQIKAVGYKNVSTISYKLKTSQNYASTLNILKSEVDAGKTVYMRTEFTDNNGPINTQVSELKKIISDIQTKIGKSIPIYLVGHSKGGLVNMRYAITHPGDVKKIISVGTPYKSSILASAQGLIDDSLAISAGLVALSIIPGVGAASIPIAAGLATIALLLDQYFVDEDLGNSETYSNLKRDWNALASKPELIAIGCSQIGRTNEVGTGSDTLVSAWDQRAPDYKNAKTILIEDKYVETKFDVINWALNGVQLIDNAVGAITSGDFITALFILKCFEAKKKPSNFGDFTLIHHRELRNPKVATRIMSIVDNEFTSYGDALVSPSYVGTGGGTYVYAGGGMGLGGGGSFPF